VDSAPVAERALAQRAGLGFIGKNHMLINPELGAQIFLGEIITTLKLQADEPMGGGCGDCDRCLKACPGEALRADGFLDASRCVSYLTIEHKDDIDGELEVKMGDRLFGCDECVRACPYHERAPVCKQGLMKYYPERASLKLQEVLEMNEERFEAKFGDSAIKRTGLARLKRNAAICLKNTGQRNSSSQGARKTSLAEAGSSQP
jgi:epoxyqueuosine reductase